MLWEIIKKDYIQTGAIYEITFLAFWRHLTHVVFKQQKKLISELLTAFNIIHFIYKIAHNIYLTSIALKTTLHAVRQPTISKQKGVAKMNSVFTFLGVSSLAWLTDLLPSLQRWSLVKTVHPIPRVSKYLILFLERKSPSWCRTSWGNETLLQIKSTC